MKIIINTVSSKKRSGGTFQVAQNYLLKTLEHQDIDWYYFTSQDLDDEIGSSFIDIKDSRYFVFPTQPDFKGSYKCVKKKLRELEEKINADVVYSVVAPSYFTFETKEVMRFTNPWVTQPNKYSWKSLPLKSYLRTKVYCWNQRRMLRKAHYFITQTDTTKQGILRITGEPESHVCVVPNVLPVTISKQVVSHLVTDEWFNIVSPAVAHPHKNLDIIPDVLSELQKRGIEKVRFHTTLPPDNYICKIIATKLSNNGLTDHWVNHGIISQEDLSNVYRRSQMVFLPTLLEVFSVSAIEAMYFELPIVATNFPFNTEVLDDACLYYEPTNAKSAADQIAKIYKSTQLVSELKNKMTVRLSKYDDYDAHFNAIKSFLINVANKTL